MIQIRFTAQGSNTLIGGFSHGDIARVGRDLAHHLVEEAKVAQYVVQPVAAPQPPQSDNPKARRTKASKPQ